MPFRKTRGSCDRKTRYKIPTSQKTIDAFKKPIPKATSKREKVIGHTLTPLAKQIIKESQK